MTILSAEQGEVVLALRSGVADAHTFGSVTSSVTDWPEPSGDCAILNAADVAWVLGVPDAEVSDFVAFVLDAECGFELDSV